MNSISKKLVQLTLPLVAFIGIVNAQNDYLHCGSSEAQNKIFEANPSLKNAFLQQEQTNRLKDKEVFENGFQANTSKSMLPVYIIPIVFHVINQGGLENISDAQIRDEVQILNNDYRKLNSDISDVVSSFTSIAADCEIEFRLAQKDPLGNCTNGIDRITSELTNSANDDSKLNPWPENEYLNVWTVKTIGTSGVAGYAYYPGGAPSPETDGVLILSNYIGSIGTGHIGTSRALTHEIGHYLNLEHTWGNTNSPGVACGDDDVSDTPLTKGHTSCVLTDDFCTPGVIENVQNYMEYAYCSNMFTTGQKLRMRDALTTTSPPVAFAGRYNLWTTANLALTGVSLPAVLCKADFESDNNSNTTCAGSSLTFTDLSWNGTPTTWSWSFPGGTPNTSTDTSPVILYNTPGVYNVSLTVSNSSGSVSVSKTDYVTVNPSTATYNNAFYSEDFEGTPIPNTDWKVYNLESGSNTWVQTNTAAASGSKSVMITNDSGYDGYVDELVSPSIDMTAIMGTSPKLSYKVAFAKKTASSTDKLQIFVSTNCGQTWTLRQTVSATALSTGGVLSTPFTPTVSEWAQKSVIFSAFESITNLYFKFRFTSNGGNNIFIDDINISGTTGIEDEVTANLNYNLYPNPAQENTVVSFALTNKQNITLGIYDVLGRSVSSIYSGELSTGGHEFNIAEKSKLSAGVYFVKLDVGKQTFTKKLIVQ